MKPTKPLNPLAPEYNPIPPGVSPDPHAPLPSFLPPPPPPPPRFLPNHLLTTYAPHNTCYVTPLPLLPPPPPWIGSGRHRGFFPGGDSSRAEKPGGKFNRNSRKPNNGFSRDRMQKGAWRKDYEHVTMPLKRDEDKTTVMIKNIPYDCPRRELIALIDRFCLLENTNASTSSKTKGFRSSYDFLYLPVDFSTKKSRGFAFVNFTNAATVWKFFEAFHGKNWNFIRPVTNWAKKLEVVTAKIQGNEALVNHFAKSIFECQTKEYLPVTFDPPRDGSGQPSQKMIAIGLHRARVANSRWEARSNHNKPT